jgi:ATP diphosphatase
MEVSDIHGTDIRVLLDIMARLRDPSTGCPWDLAQDFTSIAPYTIEEAYEVADAIARQDLDDLRGELGDLLLQVVFHARMAEEEGAFDFAGVVASIVDKMVRRHPHVFADATADDAETVRLTWEDIKAQERAARGNADVDDPFAGVHPGMAALQRASKLQQRASHRGFDWPRASLVIAKLREETDELAQEMAHGVDRERLAEELGDVLFTVVNLARHLDVDPEGALVGANARFEARFRAVCEKAGGADSLEGMDLEAMEALWQQAKRRLQRR